MANPCKAIVKNTYLPCKNHAREGHDTCHIHRYFFDKETWFQRFMRIGAEAVPSYGYREDTAVYRLTKHAEETLISGRIKITQEDVANMPVHEALTAPFLFLCKLPMVDPFWNVGMIYECIRYYFKIHHFLGPATEDVMKGWFQNTLGPIHDNPHVPESNLLKLMLKVKQKRDRTYALLGWPLIAGVYETAFNTAFLFLKKLENYCSYSDELLLERYCPKGQEEYFRTFIIPKIKEHKNEIHHRCKMKISPMKEEIVAWVYHPRHVERWLTMGEAEGDDWKYVDMMF